MSPQYHELGPLEMEVVGLLKQGKAMSVGEIQIQLKKTKHNLAYTTVMTVLVRLYKKGHLKRTKVSRQYIYTMAGSASNIGENVLSKVSQALFRNHKIKPILALLDSNDSLTKDELKELRNIVNKKINETKSK